MNSALLKEREEFRKRAMAVPVVENKKRKVEEPAKKAAAPKPATEKVKTVVVYPFKVTFIKAPYFCPIKIQIF